MAYKAEQRRRFKAVLCREPDVALSQPKTSESKQSSKSKKTDGTETRRKLDGIYLVLKYYILKSRAITAMYVPKDFSYKYYREYRSYFPLKLCMKVIGICRVLEPRSISLIILSVALQCHVITISFTTA